MNLIIKLLKQSKFSKKKYTYLQYMCIYIYIYNKEEKYYRLKI